MALQERYGGLARTITGEDPAGSRDATRIAFQEGRFPILLLTSAAGGVGLNLQRATRIFLLNEDWTPAANERVIGYAYRNGQKRDVTVETLLVPGTIDSAIHAALARKVAMATRILEGSAHDGMREEVIVAHAAAPPEEVSAQETVRAEAGLTRVLTALWQQVAQIRRRCA
jgi:hypothetical protein